MFSGWFVFFKKKINSHHRFWSFPIWGGSTEAHSGVSIHLQALSDLASTSCLVPSSLTPPQPLHPSLTGLLLQNPHVCLSFCSTRIILPILKTSVFLDCLPFVLSTQTPSSVVSSHCAHLLYVRVIILQLLVLLISTEPLSFTRLSEGKTCVCFHL